jgi:ribosomal protein S5
MVEVSIDEGSVPYNLTTKYKSAIIMIHPASK